MKLKNKLLLTTAAFALSLSSFAATTNLSTTKSKGLLQKLKDSPLSMNVLLATDAIGTTTDLSGVQQTNIAYLGYKLSDNDKVRLENRWTVVKDGDEDLTSSYSRSVFKYTRSGLMTEDKDGINLSANLEIRWLPEGESRASSNSYGLWRTSLSSSKKITDTLSIYSTAYFAVMNTKDYSNKDSNNNYLYFVTTEAFDLGNDLSLSVTEEIYKANTFSGTGETSNVALTAELGKQFTPSLYAGVSVNGSPIGSKDSWSYDKRWVENLNYGFNMSLTAF
jgi:hypothetical protein